MIEKAKLTDIHLKHRSPKFELKEIIVIQRFNKLSGKCMVSMMTEIETNLMPTFQLVLT